MLVSNDRKQRQVYVIFSIDTEHDIISKYVTRTAGWTKGIPLLCEVFDNLEISDKVCWLIEYNNKDGIPAANPRSCFFVKEFPELIRRIKNRGDELGLHPGVYDWLGGNRDVGISSYNDSELWDTTRSRFDPGFVKDLITDATKKFRQVCGVNPIGCRTGGFRHATHLASALESNGIYMDSSIRRRLGQRIKSPNAYYAAEENIEYSASKKTSVLEIPTIGYIDDQWSITSCLLKLRTKYLLRSQQPLFLSFFIHNWQAVTSDGSANRHFLESLDSSLRLLAGSGARFVSWMEAYRIFGDIYGYSQRQKGVNV